MWLSCCAVVSRLGFVPIIGHSLPSRSCCLVWSRSPVAPPALASCAACLAVQCRRSVAGAPDLLSLRFYSPFYLLSPYPALVHCLYPSSASPPPSLGVLHVQPTLARRTPHSVSLYLCQRAASVRSAAAPSCASVRATCLLSNVDPSFAPCRPVSPRFACRCATVHLRVRSNRQGGGLRRPSATGAISGESRDEMREKYHNMYRLFRLYRVDKRDESKRDVCGRFGRHYTG